MPCKEHEAVVHAVVNGDADAAALALREHVVVQGERFGDLLASMAGLAMSHCSIADQNQRFIQSASH